jgi:hypothetical protein
LPGLLNYFRHDLGEHTKMLYYDLCDYYRL